MVSGDGIDDFEVLDLMAALVERSLVVADTRGMQGRYRMLETIRRYAADRLETDADADKWRQRHATWCLEVCVLPPEFTDGYRAITDEILAMFDREQDNLRAGFDWLVARGDAEQALKMIASLGWFWYIRGYWIEGTDRALAALDLPAPVPDLVRARALTAIAILAFRRGLDSSMSPLAEEVLALDRRLGDPGPDRLLDDDLGTRLHRTRGLREGVRPRRGGLPHGHRGGGNAGSGCVTAAHG